MKSTTTVTMTGNLKMITIYYKCIFGHTHTYFKMKFLWLQESAHDCFQLVWLYHNNKFNSLSRFSHLLLDIAHPKPCGGTTQVRGTHTHKHLSLLLM